MTQQLIPEKGGLIPNIHVAAHNCVQIQLQGIR